MATETSPSRLEAAEEKSDDNNNNNNESQSPSETPSEEVENIASTFTRWQEIRFVFTVCMAQILQIAGLAQSIAPLHIIGDSFGVTDPGKLSWTAAAYSLTVGTFILPAGRLGDIYGHRKIYICGLLFYGLWALLAGVSVYSTFEFYAICRAFQGIGASMMVPNAVALIGRVYAVGGRKNMIFGLFGAAAPNGFLLGAVFSSLFSQLAWWPWTYWTTTLVAIAVAALALFSIPQDGLDAPAPSTSTTDRKGSEDSVKPTIKDFDYLGTLTGVSSLILINFSWNQAGVVGWQTPYTYILLIIGILIFGCFLYIEANIASDPLVPLRSLNKATAFILIILSAGWASFGIWAYYYWQLVEVLRHYAPLATTAQNAPVTVSGLIASLCTGWLLSKCHVSTIMLLAMVCFLTGQILLATVPVEQTYWAQTFTSLIVMPWGMDLSFPAGIAILSMNMAHADQGLASSLVNTVVNYSISMGLAFAGTIEKNVNNGGKDLLLGYRGAWWFAIGLDVLGLAFSLYFVFISRRGAKK